MNFIGGAGDQWWKLSSRLERALREASQRLDPSGARSLVIGSAVLIGTPAGDVIRVPVILRGGSKEAPVAYLRIEKPNVDKSRISALTRRLESLAAAVSADSAAATGRETEIIYP